MFLIMKRLCTLLSDLSDVFAASVLKQSSPTQTNIMVDLYGTLDPFEKKLIKLNLENKEMKNENDNWIYKLLLFESIYIIQFFSQLL